MTVTMAAMAIGLTVSLIGAAGACCLSPPINAVWGIGLNLGGGLSF
jgi:hypothetical protein